jgi:hypothetical protein
MYVPILDNEPFRFKPLALRFSFSSLSLFNSANVSSEGLNQDHIELKGVLIP